MEGRQVVEVDWLRTHPRMYLLQLTPMAKGLRIAAFPVVIVVLAIVLIVAIPQKLGSFEHKFLGADDAKRPLTVHAGSCDVLLLRNEDQPEGIAIALSTTSSIELVSSE